MTPTVYLQSLTQVRSILEKYADNYNSYEMSTEVLTLPMPDKLVGTSVLVSCINGFPSEDAARLSLCIGLALEDIQQLEEEHQEIAYNKMYDELFHIIDNDDEYYEIGVDMDNVNELLNIRQEIIQSRNN